jgi:putative ABC transport system ATP-binding protein
MAMGELIFDLRDVCKVYSAKGVETTALCGVDLKVKKGDYAAIVGPSGSGKSTLMHIMGCLDTPTRGQLFLDGKDVSQMGDDELAGVRREKIGFVFQAYNLIPGLTAIENVALPMRFAGYSRGESQKRAVELLNKVGLGERMHHKPSEMSGGEQQRVAIARSLVNDPEVIMADEPTGNLDSKTGVEIMKVVEDLHKKMKKTLIIVTHDMKVAGRAHMQIRMLDGKVVNNR